MVLVALTTVASFESVGSILVVAMLVVPAATAHLLTDRLGPMILVSLAVGLASAVLGHVSAVFVPRAFGLAATTTAGSMAVVAGVFFVAAMLLAPRHGLISKLIYRLSLALRVAREDLLGALWRAEEQSAPASASSMASFAAAPWWIRLGAQRQLVRAGKISRNDTLLQLTDAGRAAAKELVRSHRLWESYLDEHLHLPTDHLHAPAERLEHVTSSAMQGELAKATADRITDPQGKHIP
jgi:manganese/zinc/iron transport system permease protein